MGLLPGGPRNSKHDHPIKDVYSLANSMTERNETMAITVAKRVGPKLQEVVADITLDASYLTGSYLQ
jgi:hypothetical protein